MYSETSQLAKHPYHRAKVVIFDIDGTLYNQPKSLTMQAGVAFVGAVKNKLGVSYAPEKHTDQAIITAGMKSHDRHGDAYRNARVCSGANPREVHAQMHKLWDASSIGKNETLAGMLRELKANGVELYAYSDAHSDWSRRALQRIGISDLFSPDHLITRDQLEHFKTKRKGTEGFELIRQRSGKKYDEMVFVDDSTHNLKMAKKLGISTVLNDQRSATSTPYEPDFRYNSAQAFIREFLQERLSAGMVIRHGIRASETQSRRTVH